MSLKIIFWIAAAFVAVALPFLVLLSGERVEGHALLFDFSMGLGFGALALASLQFALTARFRRMTHPFGVDIIYLFHRYLAIGAVAVMLGHFAILYIWYEPALGVLNPLEARWELTSGRVALGCFIVLVVSSEFRKWLKLEYELWRYLHVALAVIGFGAAVAHVLGVGRFTAAADQRALWLGVTLGWLVLLLWVRLGKPWKQRNNPWKVVDNIERHGGVHSLVFEPQGRALSKWKPGQFVWLTLENSPFGLREHPYTISNAPEQGPNIMLSIKPLGDFSERAVGTERAPPPISMVPTVCSRSTAIPTRQVSSSSQAASVSRPLCPISTPCRRAMTVGPQCSFTPIRAGMTPPFVTSSKR